MPPGPQAKFESPFFSWADAPSHGITPGFPSWIPGTVDYKPAAASNGGSLNGLIDDLGQIIARSGPNTKMCRTEAGEVEPGKSAQAARLEIRN
jgi:hypothetical protein